MTREEAEALLPLYVAGALSDDDMKAVQAFLDRGEISAAGIDDMWFVGAASAEPGAADRRYDPQILERMLGPLDDASEHEADDEEPLVVVRERKQRDATARGEAPGGRLAALRERLQWSVTPPLAKATIAFQLALLLGLAAALTLREPAPAEGAYQAVADPVAGDYTLTFAPGVSEAQIRALLLEERARLVAGPSAIGLYAIVFDRGVDAEAAARRIRATGLVTFLQPAPRP